ncbi:MAG: SPOR domain-containing protein [Bacteroidaceae bacterium]|nr:SPOR domain-containing protein [Bacteroidaceae bacterium]
MKKSVYFGLSLIMAFGLFSCKTTQNSYKQAYEKAVQNDVVKSEVSEPVVEAPVQPVQTVQTEDIASVPVREEKVTLVTGDNIKAYSVVCGSFSLKTNADGVRERLVSDGYPAVVVLNEAGRTYRVICDSFDSKEAAVKARNAFKAKYPDNRDFQAAWILYTK